MLHSQGYHGTVQLKDNAGMRLLQCPVCIKLTYAGLAGSCALARQCLLQRRPEGEAAPG